MRRRIVSLLCFAVLGSAFALGQDLRNDRRDLRQDRRDLRHDRIDRRQDRRDFRSDNRDLRSDRRDPATTFAMATAAMPPATAEIFAMTNVI